MMNNWEDIIKAARDRKGKLGGGKPIPEKVNTKKFAGVKRPSQTRMKGGNPAEDLKVKDEALDEKDLFQYEEESTREERERLAEMTRTDLMDALMDKISGMSTQEIIDILVRTRGDLGDAL
tara:strand:+ start:5843 stop:6205 length:363 start_codon:yes stop_codon:yes gene_type:complete